MRSDTLDRPSSAADPLDPDVSDAKIQQLAKMLMMLTRLNFRRQQQQQHCIVDARSRSVVELIQILQILTIQIPGKKQATISIITINFEYDTFSYAKKLGSDVCPRVENRPSATYYKKLDHCIGVETYESVRSIASKEVTFTLHYINLHYRKGYPGENTRMVYPNSESE